MARKTGLARVASSLRVRPRSVPSTEPSPRFATCSATIAALTAAMTYAKPWDREGSTTEASRPAAAAASARVDVHVSQRAYGGGKVGRRLAALTHIAASGPYRTAASTTGSVETETSA